MIQRISANTKYQNVFFTSDWHYNHACENWPVPLWRQRGFNSLEDSNEYTIESINKTVGENDYLFNLGDVSLTCPENVLEDFIRRINCQNIFVLWGNHPSPIRKIYFRELSHLNLFKFNNIEAEVYPFRYKNLIFLGDYAEIIVDKQLMVLNHFPLAIFNESKRGAVHLCGHSHGGFPATLPGNKLGKTLDLDWGLHKKPLSFAEVMKIMDSKDIAHLDKHH